MKQKLVCSILAFCCTCGDMQVLPFSKFPLIIEPEISKNEQIRLINSSNDTLVIPIPCAYCYNDYLEVNKDNRWVPAKFEKDGKVYESERPLGLMSKGQKVLNPGDTLYLQSINERGNLQNEADSIRLILHWECNGESVKIVSHPMQLSTN